jgi:hypothetical protein
MPPQFQNNIPLTTPTNPSEDVHQGKCKHAFLLTLTIVLAITGAFGVWYFYNSTSAPDEQSETSTPLVNKLSDWKT